MRCEQKGVDKFGGPRLHAGVPGCLQGITPSNFKACVILGVDLEGDRVLNADSTSASRIRHPQIITEFANRIEPLRTIMNYKGKSISAFANRIRESKCEANRPRACHILHFFEPKRPSFV